jgi:hypothetical protein
MEEVVEIKDLHLKVADKYQKYLAYQTCKAFQVREPPNQLPIKISLQQHSLVLEPRPTVK